MAVHDENSESRAALGASAEAAYDQRRQTSNLVLSSMLRNSFNPKSNGPVLSKVGEELSAVLSARQQNRLADEYGVTTKHVTGTNRRLEKVEVARRRLKSEKLGDSRDEDVFEHAFFIDD